MIGDHMNWGLIDAAVEHGHTMMVDAPAYRRAVMALVRAERGVATPHEIGAALAALRGAVVMRRKLGKPAAT